jgi:hypothetical protein
MVDANSSWTKGVEWFTLVWRPAVGDLVLADGRRCMITQIDYNDGDSTYYVVPIGETGGDWTEWIDKADSQPFIVDEASPQTGDRRFKQKVLVEVWVEFTGDYERVTAVERASGNGAWLNYCSMGVDDPDDWLSFDGDLRSPTREVANVTVSEITVLDKT